MSAAIASGVSAPRRFVTLEGGEGVGKSTQIARLAERLRSLGNDVVVTREPGGTPLAERIRDILLSGEAADAPLTEALLFNAARADHLQHLIRPGLAAGAFVVCDRFMDSTRAYQGVAGRLAGEVIEALQAIVVAGTTPGLTLILELDPATALARARARTGQGVVVDAFEARGMAFHQALVEAFRAICAREPDRCRLIDANGDADQVAERVWQAVAQHYRLAWEAT